MPIAKGDIEILAEQRITQPDPIRGIIDAIRIDFSVKGLGTHSVTLPADGFSADLAIVEIQQLADQLIRVKEAF